MEFNKSVQDIIRQRQSIRAYSNVPFKKETIENIEQILEYNKVGPFGNIVNFHLIEKEVAKENHKIKLGTYGFITGARYFIAGEANKLPFCFEDYGFLLEKIILHLTDLGLGTCWLGGTFNRSEYSKILNSNTNTVIPAITPVGYFPESKSMRERLVRWAASSDNRKSWNELFFFNSFESPILSDEASMFAQPLEMVRLAPSASNKQPWRIIKENNSFHFFLKRTPGYGKYFKDVDLQRIDMGIAMAHFQLTCQSMSLPGSWKQVEMNIDKKYDVEYIASWGC
jgi:nitroreductase